MPYLAVDFDARKRAALIATSLGVHPGVVQWGLEEMWELGWRTKTDRIGTLMLTGFFGSDERVVPLLLVHEFLEDLGGGSYRIRGASRYLRISETQSAAGRARAATAKRDQAGRMCPASQPDASRNPAAAGVASSRCPASSSSDHRAAVEDLAGAVAPAGSAPPEAPGTSDPTQHPPPAGISRPGATSGSPVGYSEVPAQAVLVSVPARTADPVDALKDEWNSYPELPTWLQTGKGRRRKALLRLEERPMDGPTGWREVIRRIAASDFCLGKAPVRDGAPPWRASPDWLVANGENAVKVLEGKYDGRARPSRPDPNGGILICPPGAQNAPPPPPPDPEPCEICGEATTTPAFYGHQLCSGCTLFSGRAWRAAHPDDPGITDRNIDATIAEYKEARARV